MYFFHDVTRKVLNFLEWDGAAIKDFFGEVTLGDLNIVAEPEFIIKATGYM
jgi:hypothetical protein